MPLDAGVRLGTFEIVEPIGAGGMGEVYRARDRRLGRDVAVKILPGAFGRDPSRVARFEREARLLAALNHPGIAAIYGAEEADELRYLVLELVPGETLAEKLGRGALPMREALEIGRQISEALDAAHERGVIHRDLKPSNVKITPGGKVKVLDFGLAKAMPLPRAEGASETPTLVADPSAPGTILGTIEFMSPEQARGVELDRRTDIWSFGCILFEMLSGRRAFTGATSSDALAAILTAEPDWTVLPATTPARVRELLERCLQKDTARRLRDAGDATVEIERTLAELSSGTGRAAAVPAPEPRGHLQTILLAAAAAAVVLAGWLFVHRSARPGAPASEERSLVVLPSRDLSGTAEGQLIGDGLAETLSARLGQLPGIQVVTPVAAVAASDRSSDPLNAARSVGAGLAVRSSLMRSGQAVRITYSLWNVRTRSQIVGGTVDGTAADLFGIQDQLVDRVADGLKVGRGSRTPPPAGLSGSSAQERYLQALGNLQRYDKRARIEEGIAILEKLQSEQPGSALVPAALGRAYLYEYNLTREPRFAESAEASAARARQLDPAAPEVDITLGELYVRTGRALRAIEAFDRALAARPNSFDALLGLAGAYDAAGDTSRAESTYQKALRLQPEYFGGYSKVAGFYFRHGRSKEAADAFRRVTELAPDNARAFANLGAAYYGLGDFDRALSAFRKSLELEPNEVAYTNMGTVEFFLGRYPEAAQAFQSAIGLAPAKSQLWINLGDCYRWMPGREARAAEAFRKGAELARAELAVNPRNALSHSILALCLAKTGQPGSAREHAELSRSIEPKDPIVLYGAGVVAEVGGRRKDAIELLRSAVEAGYPARVAELDPELKKIREDRAFAEILKGKGARGS